VRFSIPYQFVTEQIVYRRGSKRPRGLDDIAGGDLHVIAGSSHDETLERLRVTQQPMLEWTRHDDIATEGLLSAVDRGDIRLTVTDSNDIALNQRIYRHVAEAFELGDPRPSRGHSIQTKTAACSTRPTVSSRRWSPTEN
jgi:membrane-bound lytic murein transglycosylase F